MDCDYCVIDNIDCCESICRIELKTQSEWNDDIIQVMQYSYDRDKGGR